MKAFRNTFNGGEFSPNVQMRADLEAYQRGCAVVENFDVMQTGGVKRRRGFRTFAPAQGADSRLFGYAYSNETRYLVEVGADELRVYDTDGTLVFCTESPYTPQAVATLRSLQVNSVLVLTCRYVPPMQLVCDAQGAWRFELMPWKCPPWRYREYRERAVKVTHRADGYFDVVFDPLEDAPERTPLAGEVLRASFYTDARELKENNATAFARVALRWEEAAVSADTPTVPKGTVLAVRREQQGAVYSVVQDWAGSTAFAEGLIDPANYPTYFQLSSDTTLTGEGIAELTKELSYKKGQRLLFQQGYWDLFTCVSEFVGSRDARPDGLNPEDYPGHFVRGMMLGAAPCKGRWALYTSGTWYGSYEVRAAYDGSGAFDDAWEFRGECFSRNAAPTNTPIAGDEGMEECYLSLWLTRVRAYGSTWSARNFPADSCGNVLSVSSYKHDAVLRFTEVGEGLDGYFVSRERIPVPWYGSLETRDWSWCAFSQKYGFPRLACLLNQRLVFAGTDAQPQTIWLSQVDDLDNFDIVDSAAGAMAVTMSCPTQDPIRWMMAQKGRIFLGTGEGEYVMEAPNEGALAYNNVMIGPHGYVGAADFQALQCTDKLVYFERGGARVMQYGYDYAQDAYISTDLTVFADHVLADGGGVTDGCFIRKPDPKAVLVRRDGQLALCTYNAMHQVNAWHRYRTDGKFLAVAMLPNGDRADTLFAVVERMIVRPVPDGLPDPDDKVAVYSIEACDEDSPFADAEERDYVSTLLTNAVASTRLGNEKQQAAEVALFLPRGQLVQDFEVTTGTKWTPMARNRGTLLEPGWHVVCAESHNARTLQAGFRVWGRRDFGVLALQV